MTTSERPPYLLWVGLLALAAGFAALGWWAGHRALLPAERDAPPGVSVVEIGGIVPDMPLIYLNSGDPASLRPQGRRARLINYWASWCGPCRAEMPILDAYAAQQGANGVEVVGIALDERDAALAFIAQVPVRFALWLEPASERDSSVWLGNARGVLPYTVLIDAEGRLQKRHYGAFPDVAAVADWVRAAD